MIGRNLEAYQSFDFHVVYHSLYNYCTVDLSAFYLDILKDRLYTSLAGSLERRSAQTVMYQIVEALSKLMAPVLPFTAEEVWAFMPEVDNKQKSIHLAEFPKADPGLMDEDLARRWETIIRVRGEVTRVLETARAEKQIGHSLDASVTLAVSKNLHDVLAPYEADLKSIFIVSAANLMSDENMDGFVQTEVEGLWVKAGPAPGEKCQRCWIYDTSVNLEADGGGICTRCRNVLDRMERL